ncbi:MAG: alpha/beta hydrolase, partial [Lachnospiraceae bacterium]|nr:alpha/beta hydrolase [Lachnospiraceae bacterium]
MGRQAEEKKLTVGGVCTDYIEFGNGNIPLVLVPGLSLRRVKGTGLAIARMYRIFADQYKVYLFDRRDDIPEGFTVQDMAEDLAAAMGELGIRSACVLGISQGGMIAQYLAMEHPEL